MAAPSNAAKLFLTLRVREELALTAVKFSSSMMAWLSSRFKIRLIFNRGCHVRFTKL